MISINNHPDLDIGLDEKPSLEPHFKLSKVKNMTIKDALKVIDWVNVRLMPIVDWDFNVVSYELLSSKNWLDTESLMNDIDDVEWWKTELFIDVFSRALTHLWKNNESNINNVPLSINIWPEELANTKLIDFLINTDLELIKYINLEILEYSFWNNGLSIYKNLKKLKEVWYNIIIDDFWTKSSDKKRVLMFEEYEILDWIKLDWKFLDDLKDLNSEDLEEYKTYFNWIRQRWIDITAEYIRNNNDNEFAKSLWANKFQWEYFDIEDKK